ncbi:hypothetical protein MAR_020203 [Mya arenaria]|uniref:Uncharacterized protein n=1 Tax=Mya arenaria TaxID=6604 RepID=A0ABY7E8V9_MYAAR|nr:hypothetical protein MAR_020203 [Mya arenaria]
MCAGAYYVIGFCTRWPRLNRQRLPTRKFDKSTMGKFGRKCSFQHKWMEKYKWVKSTTDPKKARCTVCLKDFDVCNMGESALSSHAQGSKHKKNEKIKDSMASTGIAFLKEEGTISNKNETTPTDLNNNVDSSLNIPPPPTSSQSKPMTMDSFVSKADTKKAEILWTLNTICNHHSYNSNTDIEKLFRTMFPDSPIAKSFSCGERKTAYLAVFGIGSYFLEDLKSSITGPYSVMFDESLNKKDQSKQMDIHVRYWIGGKVVTRYYTSQFLGHATAKDMLEHFSTGVLESGLKPGDMVQISMDGPSDQYDTKLLNVGSCGLHMVHNSFKTGAEITGWGIDDVLGSMYYLFKHTPARREDYLKITGSSKFPLKFVNHRWLENVRVSERAIEVWDFVVAYVKEVESNKKYTKPTCKSYGIIKAAVNDPLMLAKLHFFKTVAKLLEPFLEDFQSSSPMVCFLAKNLETTVVSLFCRFIQPDATEASRIIDIDPDTRNCT